VARSSIAALAAACALAPAPASAISQRPADGTLSPRLAQLSKSTVRSAPRALQAEKLGTAPDGPGSLLRRGNRVLVEVRFDHGAAAGVAMGRAEQGIQDPPQQAHAGDDRARPAHEVKR
jgi:hypothetical protein